MSNNAALNEEQKALIKTTEKIVQMGRVEAIDGILQLLQIEHDESNTGRGFWNNRQKIMESWRENRFFIVKMIEDDALFKQGDCFAGLSDDIFQRDHQEVFLHYSEHLLPAFYTLDRNDSDPQVDILWVHPSFRRMGLGKLMVEHAKSKEVFEVLESSVSFWNAMGIKYKRVVSR